MLMLNDDVGYVTLCKDFGERGKDGNDDIKEEERWKEKE